MWGAFFLASVFRHGRIRPEFSMIDPGDFHSVRRMRELFSSRCGR